MYNVQKTVQKEGHLRLHRCREGLPTSIKAESTSNSNTEILGERLPHQTNPNQPSNRHLSGAEEAHSRVINIDLDMNIGTDPQSSSSSTLQKIPSKTTTHTGIVDVDDPKRSNLTFRTTTRTPTLRTTPNSQQPPLTQRTWIDTTMTNLKPVTAEVAVSEVIESNPDKGSLCGLLLGFNLNQTLPMVNQLIIDLQSSNDPHETRLQQLREQLHPGLTRLITPAKKAFVKGLVESKKLNKRAETAEEWSNHGIGKIIRPINQLSATIREYALEQDFTMLDSQLEEFHRAIAASTILRRQRDPAAEPRTAILKALKPILDQVEQIVRGQLNCSVMLQGFLAHVEVALIVGMLSNRPQQPERAPTDATTETNTTQPTKEKGPEHLLIDQIVETLAQRFLPSLIENAVRKVVNDPNEPDHVERPPQQGQSTGPSSREPPPGNSKKWQQAQRSLKPSSASGAPGPNTQQPRQNQRYITSQTPHFRPTLPNYSAREQTSSYAQDEWSSMNYRPRPRKPSENPQSGNSFPNPTLNTPSYRNPRPTGPRGRTPTKSYGGGLIGNLGMPPSEFQPQGLFQSFPIREDRLTMVPTTTRTPGSQGGQEPGLLRDPKG